MGRYRTALEALKNNARFLYHLRPLSFDCAYHHLTSSFHLIANHAANIPTFNFVSSAKSNFDLLVRPYTSTSPTLQNFPVINPWDSDTLRHYLDSRFVLLNTSLQLAFWEDVFHSAGCLRSSDYGREGVTSDVKLARFLASGSTLFGN
jgi:hypothetical protein